MQQQTNLSSPAAQSAQQACTGYGDISAPVVLSEAHRLKLVKLAHCLRAQGVPNFPDPASNNIASAQLISQSGIDPQLPAFKHAADACGNQDSLVTGAAEWQEPPCPCSPIEMLCDRARRQGSLVARLLVAGLLVAGCGSSSPTSSASRTVAAQALAYSKCMRAHGVSNFPDRGDIVNGPHTSILGIEIPASINMQSPAYESANKSCGGLLAAILSPQGKPPITANTKAALIAQAQCMREHGVPNYPDPTFPGSGGIDLQTGPGVDTQSPAFLQAQKTCRTGG